MKNYDPVQLVAALNPVPHEAVAALEYGPERGLVRGRIDAQRHQTSALSQQRRVSRKVAFAVAVLIALSVPALALSGVLGPLFGFSNQGTPLTHDNLSRATAVLNLTGARPNSLVRLAARDSWAIYADRTTSGNYCFYDGPAGNSNLNEIGGGCMNAAASAAFPTPRRPVWDMSLFQTGPPQPDTTITGPSIARLTGVAADGVTTIELLALTDCRVVATAPVIDNVYIATNLPTIPEAMIVARNASGNAVWHESVPPKGPTCGLS